MKHTNTHTHTLGLGMRRAQDDDFFVELSALAFPTAPGLHWADKAEEKSLPAP